MQKNNINNIVTAYKSMSEGEGLDTLQTRAHKSAARDKARADDHREAAKHDKVAKMHRDAYYNFLNMKYTGRGHIGHYDHGQMHHEAGEEHKNAASMLRKGHKDAKRASKRAHSETEYLLDKHDEDAHPPHEYDPRHDKPSVIARREYSKIKPGTYTKTGETRNIY